MQTNEGLPVGAAPADEHGPEYRARTGGDRRDRRVGLRFERRIRAARSGKESHVAGDARSELEHHRVGLRAVAEHDHTGGLASSIRFQARSPRSAGTSRT